MNISEKKLFILTMKTINCSGRIYGPYGGKGGRYFEAIPPNPHNRDGKKIHCFLGWISGQSDRRLDSISFHWKCPKEPSHMYPEELETFREYQVPSSKPQVLNESNGCLCVNNVFLIFLLALSIIFVSTNYNSCNIGNGIPLIR